MKLCITFIEDNLQRHSRIIFGQHKTDGRALRNDGNIRMNLICPFDGVRRTDTKRAPGSHLTGTERRGMTS